MLRNNFKKEKQTLNSTKPYRFILSGGGTGGHIFPALAIANELKRVLPNAEFLFVGAQGKMEMEKVPKAGYQIIGLPIAGFQRSLSAKNLLFPFKLLKSMRKAKSIIKSFQPDVVIGTGGYASGPTLKAAQYKSIPTFIQEQNSFPGVTNKLLGKKATKVFVAYDHLNQYFPEDKIVNAGNPVRAELFDETIHQKEAKTFFGLHPDKFVVLSVGGSLGSRTLNQTWLANHNKLLENDCQLLWQTGTLEFNQIPDEVKQKGGIVVKEFIYKMNLAYAAADVIVSRAGAIAISELVLVGKPMILVPYPYAAEDHQTKNADALVKENAAIMIADRDAKANLTAKVLELKNDKQLQNELSENTKLFAKPQATETIVKTILNTLQR